MRKDNSTAREKILSRGRELMLKQGFNGTGIDEICKAAGVTKGALFYYFPNKDELAIALLDYHWTITQQMLAQTPYGAASDPLQRILLYVDLFIAMGRMPGVPMSCLFGNLTQELGAAENSVVEKCKWGFTNWAKQISDDLRSAQEKYETASSWSAHEIAEYFVSIYEGSLILVKAQKNPEILSLNMTHFRSYLSSLFVFKNKKPKIKAKGA